MVDLMSVVIVLFCTTLTVVHHSFWGGTHWNFMYVFPIFMQGIICEKNIPRLPRCDIDVQEFPRVGVRPFMLG